MFNIVLISPEHPGNVGNIGRTCVLTESRLHLIRPFKFDFSDRFLKRAGIDYWEHVDLVIHDSLEEFMDYVKDERYFFIETGTNKKYTDVDFKDGDFLIFGREKEGIPEDLLNENKEKILTIPMTRKINRSLNLANSVSIVLYEALRQDGFKF
ncbi:MAG: tRNA (cytidine(34)-2'-O)-methyltransferase [Anaerococcus sp.]|uniref:tRNA (cytidine(34)-2'-O)-methyltransferase n=1 Tax=Anaerococcus TaxID=165779 RepID=UPI002612A830|nr:MULTISPECIES: tRNA (cytidine(34)-2'-O)-methyltransferase [Anaerococcus]MCI5971767.1 tRNA (cytidine(34)-2'-O)-methyltransferase [Anaerococcus sp.]MDD6918228.1 tRNA (cytidine(34)-2'-O)-methyltransferase [Peptoniphilaceae bacterium]MDU2557502.1 tRNA (cytidine(34)-2'-O)-methyltransferase [Anaerococcus prevotii]MDY2927840.1 tRNA (cytidine(34)-2'-O)-methyltransferase [Anaerococcus sp.]